VKGLPASYWRSHFAVNTHCSQGWNSQMVYNLTTYLGVSAIRDSLPTAGQAGDYAKMFAAGIRLNVVAGGVPNKTAMQAQVQTWSNFQTTSPGMLQSIEGFNEINNFGFVYNGIQYTTTYAGMAQAMVDLYTIVRFTSNLNTIPVLDLTGGGFSDGPQYGLLNWTQHADLGTVHTYPFSGWPSVSAGATQNYFLDAINGYTCAFSSASSIVVTEMGYHTDLFPNGISEAAQAKLTVNMLLNGLFYNVKQTFIYELIDEYWAGYDGQESHFGLFRNNKTTKPVARALHFLSGLLSDKTQTPNPASLSIRLQSLPFAANYLLFQNSTGAQYLVVWNNAPVWNDVTQADLTASAVSVTLTLSSTMNLRVYDIYSTTADDTKPLSPTSTHTASSLAFTFTDKAVVIGISSSG